MLLTPRARGPRGRGELRPGLFYGLRAVRHGGRVFGLVFGLLGGLLGGPIGAATAASVPSLSGQTSPTTIASTEPLPVRSAASEPPVDEASVLAPAIVELPQSPRRTRWFGRASLGVAYRWAFDESMFGAALEGELGAHDPRLAGGVRLRIEVGKMLSDLAYQVVSFGPFLWLPAMGERVRLGFGLDAGALFISRRTMPGSTLWSILMGGQVRLNIDLLRIGPSGALQADAGLAVQALTAAPGPFTIATTLGVGYRP